MHPSPRPPFPVPIPIPVPSAFPLPRQPGLGLWVAAPVEPRHPSQYVETFPVEPLTTSAWSNPSPTTKPTTEQNDQFRLSMERFHAFDSQISTIHTRTSQSPPPPGSAANVGANINLAVPASQARVDDKVAGVDGRVASVGNRVAQGQGQASGQVQSVPVVQDQSRYTAQLANLQATQTQQQSLQWQQQQQQHQHRPGQTQDATQPSQMPFSMNAQKAHQRERESKRESEPRGEPPRDGVHLPLMVPTTQLMFSTPTATTSTLTMATSNPAGVSGPWADEEVDRLRRLADQSRSSGSSTETDWDWVVGQWGNTRTRHQILLKATALGFKPSTTRRFKREGLAPSTSEATPAPAPPMNALTDSAGAVPSPAQGQTTTSTPSAQPSPAIHSPAAAEKRKVREVCLMDMKRCAKIAQLLVEGKKGADLQAAVEEFDKSHVPTVVTPPQPPTPSAHKVDNASHVDLIRPPERLHPTLSCWLKNIPTTQPMFTTPTATTSTLTMATINPAGVSGAWADEEVERLRRLADQSQSSGSSTETDWDWVVGQWGNTRTRHQILLKATALGLKASTTRRVQRRREGEAPSTSEATPAPAPPMNALTDPAGAVPSPAQGQTTTSTPSAQPSPAIHSPAAPPQPPTPSAHKVDNASHVDFIRPPERLHPTLSCWLKNMKKLSSLIDRLQELASAAPPDLKPQLHKQVAMLRSSFKKQQERCVEFLRLTEEYADRYLRDISAEIEQQSSFLDMLEKRLDMAKTLYGQAMDLRKSYESGTVDTMKDVRKALRVPIPADFDLFKEVDFVLNEIRRCYTELDKFWTEEICRAAKALETRRVDPDDAKRWRDFKASLEKTVKSWKTTKQGSSTWYTPRLSSSSGTDLGAIASALSPALATLEETLQRVRTSASIAPSPKKVALALRVGCGSRKNKESCLTFFRRCIRFAETIAAFSATFMAQPSFSHVRASSDLQERVVALGTEAAGVSTESATQFQAPRSPGSRRFNSVYKRSLSLQRGHELNTLLKDVSSWIVFADGLPNVSLGGIRLGLLHDLADAWEKGRTSIRRMLADLTDDPDERLRCQALSLTSPRLSVAGWFLKFRP